jgi:hypothetical protein
MDWTRFSIKPLEAQIPKMHEQLNEVIEQPGRYAAMQVRRGQGGKSAERSLVERKRDGLPSAQQ